jgi:hypothetical protein
MGWIAGIFELMLAFMAINTGIRYPELSILIYMGAAAIIAAACAISACFLLKKHARKAGVFMLLSAVIGYLSLPQRLFVSSVVLVIAGIYLLCVRESMKQLMQQEDEQIQAEQDQAPTKKYYDYL